MLVLVMEQTHLTAFPTFVSCSREYLETQELVRDVLSPATDPVVLPASTSLAVLPFHLVAWMYHLLLLSESLQIVVLVAGEEYAGR